MENDMEVDEVPQLSLLTLGDDVLPIILRKSIADGSDRDEIASLMSVCKTFREVMLESMVTTMQVRDDEMPRNYQYCISLTRLEVSNCFTLPYSLSNWEWTIHLTSLELDANMSEPEYAKISLLHGLERLALLEWPHSSESDVLTLKGFSKLRILELQFSDGLNSKFFEKLRDVPTLEELNLHNSAGLSVDALTHLTALTGLRALDLSLEEEQEGFCVIRDAHLAPVTCCSALERLNLTHCIELTDAALEHLSGLTTLQELCLSHCAKITDAGVRHLSALKALRKLDLSLDNAENREVAAFLPPPAPIVMDVNDWMEAHQQHLRENPDPGVSNRGLQHLARMTALEDLNLNNCCRIGGAGLRHISHLTRLKHLGLRQCYTLGNDTQLLAGFTALESLNLCNVLAHSKTPSLEFAAGMANLRSLDLKWAVTISADALAVLANLPNLAFLNLKGCAAFHPTDAHMSALAGMTALRELKLQDVRISDAGFAALGALSKLQALYLRLPGMSEAAASGLAGLVSLTKLCLCKCEHCNEDALRSLARLTTLKSLKLNFSRVTDAVLDSLSGLPCLQSLELFGCHDVTDAGLACLSRTTTLRLLDVRDCARVTAAGLAPLSRVKHCKSWV